MTTRSKLILGPVPYLWDGPKWRDFYFRIADEAPVDVVSLGETVCSKRLHFFEPHFDAVIERLQAAGKEVHLATLALITLERERRMQAALLAREGFTFEASDLSALHLLKNRPHTISPLVNTYNAATARLYAARGATAIALPPELPLASIAGIAAGAPEIAFEIFAFGRVPLAISARCAHARARGHTKDNCHFICGEDPDGLSVETLDHQPFLALNGVQTVSHTCNVLLNELAALGRHGIRRFRLSPQHCDMGAVAQTYRAVLDGTLAAGAGLERLRALYPDVPFSNGFIHGTTGAEWIDAA